MKRSNSNALLWETKYGDKIITPGNSLPECLERAKNRYGITFLDRNQRYDRYGEIARVTDKIEPGTSLKVSNSPYTEHWDTTYPATISEWLRTAPMDLIVTVITVNHRLVTSGTPSVCLTDIRKEHMENCMINSLYQECNYRRTFIAMISTH